MNGLHSIWIPFMHYLAHFNASNLPKWHAVCLVLPVFPSWASAAARGSAEQCRSAGRGIVGSLNDLETAKPE
jgi:hypothetical protein